MDHSSDNLVDRLRRDGSPPDWEQFIDLYNPLLHFWARRLSRPDEAADLVQDVLLLVMQKLRSFAGEGDRSFLAWLWAVMRNRWRDLCRRAASRPRAGDPAFLDAVAADDGVGELTEAEDRDRLIRRALQIMQSDFEPTTWRACWEAVACGRRAAEVAAELGVSVEVVYSASYRVLRRLRSELAGPGS
jgi:RNA polymerase sigma-70 factor (ECF subfamily)